MKKTLLLTIALLLGIIVPQRVCAYDLTTVTSAGQTLYFNVNGTYLTVTSGPVKPTGDLVIPSMIISNGTRHIVTAIGALAFNSCPNLTSVTIPSSVTSIGNEAFYNCSGLTSVTIPNSVTSIGNYVFYKCSGLTSVTIPSSVTSIGNYAFSYCSGLTSVTIPNSVTSIGEGVFSFCSGLTSVTIPSSVTSIGDAAFLYCTGLTSVTIPNSVTSIGHTTFYGCTGLTSVTIPSSVTSIGEGAFLGCTSLTSVTIPSSVTSIGDAAFSYCTGLTSVTMEGNTPPVLGDSYVFRGTAENLTFTIPCGTLSAYQNAWGTDYYGEAYNFVSTVTRSSIAEIRACDSYTWPLNGVTYTENPTVTPTARLVNAASDGCDSLVTLNLAFGPGIQGIGDQSTTENKYLWSYSYYNYSFTEQIYRKEEMGGEKNLTAMQMKFSNYSHTRDISIFLGHTNQNSVENWIMPDDLTLVWSGNESFNYNNVWSGIVFDTPFHYNGEDNLLLVIVDNTGDYESSPYNHIYTHSNTGYKSRYVYSDDINDIPINADAVPTAAGNVSYERINVIWHFNCNLTVETEERTICDNQLPYTWNDVVFTEAGTQQTTLASGNTLQMTLHVNPSERSRMYMEYCGPYTWAANGRTYNQSGIKTYKGVAENGCPSYDTLILNIVDRWSRHDRVVSCDAPYTWPINGKTYNKSGIKTHKSVGLNDCPLYDTLILIIGQSESSHEYVTHCGSYTWEADGRTYNKSGNKYYKGRTDEGCPRRDTLTLTIVDKASNHDTVTHCGSYTWDVNGKTYNKSGVKYYKATEANGCKVYDTLTLTIVDKTTNHEYVTHCGPYTWSVNDKTYNKSGVKTYKGVNEDGCKVYDTLTLTVVDRWTSHDTVVSSGPYTWYVNGKTYNKSGVKTYKGVAQDGCTTYDTLTLVITSKGSNSQDKMAERVKVYPNPTTGRVELNVTEADRVEVLDLVGRRVALYENTNTIDLSPLADGTYTLRITLPDGVALRKVVKR